MGRQAIKLDHANIVRTYEADQDGETVYLVRELIDEVLDLVETACDGLIDHVLGVLSRPSTGTS